MRVDCLAALRTQRMPTTRNEEYRFTDIAPILQLEPEVSHGVPPCQPEQSLNSAQSTQTKEQSTLILWVPASAEHADALETTVNTRSRHFLSHRFGAWLL